MTQYEFDNQKWYKGIQVHINFGNWTGYVAFVDFEKGNIGVSRTSNFYPFEIFKFHEVTVIDKIQPTALDLIAAEREKQISKGYTVEHDQAYTEETGMGYDVIAMRLMSGGECPPEWDKDYWNRLLSMCYSDRLRIAGAWFVTELDRHNYHMLKP